MIAAFLLSASQAVAPPVPAQDPPLVVPTLWSAIPPLPWRVPPTMTPEVTAFIAGEVRMGRCVPPMPGTLDVDLAIYVRADGVIRAAVPRAIDCPGVEQFTAGLVTSFARSNLRPNTAGWYRTTITYDWGK